jgi:hypothetical protein
MKSEERRASEFLKSIGFSNILYEPDGNIPPDFLIDGKIAIEVRRLNQYFDEGSKPEPLEKLEFKLIPRIERLLNEIYLEDFSHSAAVMVRFQRPLKINKELIVKIKNQLVAFAGKVEQPLRVQFDENLLLDLRPLSQKHERYYYLGFSDYDSGGLLTSIFYEGLKTAIVEKQKKIIKYFHKYPEWWLILVDRIGYSYEEADIIQIKEREHITNNFKKIFVISPYKNTASINYQ